METDREMFAKKIMGKLSFQNQGAGTNCLENRRGNISYVCKRMRGQVRVHCLIKG